MIEKPPVITILQTMVHGDPRDETFNEGAKAQRDADIKWFIEFLRTYVGYAGWVYIPLDKWQELQELMKP